MPILIILLFYIHDLVKIKRYYSQNEFVAQQMANILQNISQKREDKKITITDIKHAFCLAHLSLYPGTSLFSSMRFAHLPEMFITYVVGNPDGTASCKWVLNLWGGASKPVDISYQKRTGQHDGSTLNFAQNATPSNIHPSLKMNPGNEKIVIECSTMYVNTYADYLGHKPGSAKKSFGYFLLDKQPERTRSGGGWYYHSVVIFTPKPGLFDTSLPADN